MNASDRLKQLKEEQNRNKEKIENDNRKATRFAVVFIIICVIVCIIGLIAVFGDEENNGTSTSNNNLNSTCYYYSQRLVKEKLKSPNSAEFPKYSASYVEKSGDTVIVSAYVNAQNSFGATIRTDYVATIKIEDGKPVSGSVVLIE